MAFYSPMMHDKRNLYAQLQQNWCRFGHAFSNSGLAGRKNAIFTIHKKNQNCARTLQVGSFCGEWRGEQMF